MSDTQVTRREARALDRALAGDNGHEDPDGLVATAAQLRAMFDFEVPNWGRDRAMFVSGVSTRHHRFNPLRVMVPALAFVALVAIAFLGGRTALPGDTLYPVRQALGSVGLAESPIEEIDARVGEAASLLSKAERSLDPNPGTSLRLAVEALETLGPAIDLLDELKGVDLETRSEAIEALEGRAVDVISAVATIGQDDDGTDVGRGSSGRDSATNSSGGNDRSGSNRGGHSGVDDSRSRGGDNSGSGSAAERSGSNSGSDSDSDDSGPGSDSGDDSGSGGGDNMDPEVPDVGETRSGGVGGDNQSNSGPGGGGKDEIDLDG